MNMKQRNILIHAFDFTAIASAFIAITVNGFIRMIFMALSAILLVTGVILHLCLWRCPHCKSHLGRIDFGTHCKYCGKELYD